ncbi:MAG TPA: hypothetical protein VLC95_11630, partial [Anaerolineae bacterium]|nr:hypothetical protein [Anaerolineae bacterium]
VIEVSYNRGTLTLIGNVPTREDREAVELVALAQPGIDSLVLAVDVGQEGPDRVTVSGPISTDELSR